MPMVWFFYLLIITFQEYYNLPDGPIYFDDPKANIGQKIIGNNINPTVNPSLFPKLFEVRFNAQIKKIKFKYGTQNNNNQYQGFPMIFSQTSVEYIGTIEAHPGSFALIYKNQEDNTGKRITIKINRIWNGPIIDGIIYIILIKIKKKLT